MSNQNFRNWRMDIRSCTSDPTKFDDNIKTDIAGV